MPTCYVRLDCRWLIYIGYSLARELLIMDMSRVVYILQQWFLSLVLLLLFCVSASANDFSLLLNGKALHLQDAPVGQTFNEKNWGAGFQYDFTDNHEDWVPFMTASGFLDSHKKPSYYAGGGMMRRFQWAESGFYTDVGLVGFLMTRENFKDNKPFPGILPVMTLGTEDIAVNITYIPKVDPKMVALFFFQLKVNIFTF